MPVIRKNQKKEGIELTFDKKPPLIVLDWLKDHKFRWSNVQMVWWKKFNEKDWIDVHEYFGLALPDDLAGELSSIRSGVGFARALPKIMDEAFARQKPYRDAFLKRKGLTDDQFNALSQEEKDKLQDEWPKSEEFKNMNESVAGGVVAKERPSVWITNETVIGDLVKRLIAKFPNARYIGIDENILIGIKIEREHAKDEAETWRIVFDHLWEDFNYYTKAKPANWAKKEIEKESKDPDKIKIDTTSMAPISTYDDIPEGHRALVDNYADQMVANEVNYINETFIPEIGKESHFTSIKGTVTQEKINELINQAKDRGKAAAFNYYKLIIDKNDYKRLHGFITNTQNRASRKLFETITRIKVGKTIADAEKAVNEYFGSEVVKEEQKKAAEKKQERIKSTAQAKIDKDLEKKVKIDGVVKTYRQHIDEEIAKGFNKISEKKVGVINELHLSNDKGVFWTYKNKSHKDYIKQKLGVDIPPVKAEAIFPKKNIAPEKSMNEAIAEEKIKNYIPIRADSLYIYQLIQQNTTKTLYEACVEIYNHKVENRGDSPIESGNNTADEFILKLMKFFIEKEWDGKVIPEKQRFSFQDISYPTPELSLPAKEGKRTTKPVPTTIEEMVKCMKHLTGSDPQRPMLQYVYRDDKGVTATDAYVLLHVPTTLGKEFKYYAPVSLKVYSAGNVQIGTYPNYKSIIPDDFEFTSQEVDLEVFLNVIEPYRNTYKLIVPYSNNAKSAFIRFMVNGANRFYDSFKLFQIADALFCQATRFVTFNFPFNKNHPVVLKDPYNGGRLGLIMPILASDENDPTKGSFFADITNLIITNKEDSKSIRELTIQKIYDALQDKNFWLDPESESAKIIEQATNSGYINRISQTQAELTEKGLKELEIKKSNDFIKEHIIVGTIPKHIEIRKEFLRDQEGLKIYLVDGEAVRKDHIEFVSGGHGYVYDYIPKDEVWIDDNQKDKPNDMEATIRHELFEIKKMRDEGLSYEDAHELANAMEKEIRQKSDIDKKTYTLPELREIYSYENGFNLSDLDLDNIVSGTHTRYVSIGKLRGTYPNYERDPKFKGHIIDSDYKWFVEISEGQYKETASPYKHGSPDAENKYPFKKGDLVTIKEQYRDKGDNFTYEIQTVSDLRAEIVPIDSKLNIPPLSVVNINQIEMAEDKLPEIPAPPKKYAKLNREYNGRPEGTQGEVIYQPNMFVSDILFEDGKKVRIDNTYLVFIKNESTPDKKLNPFIAMYKGKRHELYSDSKYHAQIEAAKFFKVPEKDSYKVDVYLAVEDKKPEEKPDPEKFGRDAYKDEFNKNLTILKPFMSDSQAIALRDIFKGEEWEFAKDKAKELAGIIESMPHTYQTEKTETDDKIVYLHYFIGGSDWYIVEKDKNKDQNQMFGYAILNDDHEMAEWGYVSAPDLKQNNVELDFYWTPKKFSEVRGKVENGDAGERSDEEERKMFGYSFMFDPANDEGLKLINALQGFNMVIGLVDYPNGISIEYRTEKYELLDNSGEFKLNRISREGYPDVIDFKDVDGKLKSVFNLAKEIEQSILISIKKQPGESPKALPIIEHAGEKYYVDFKLRQLRNARTAVPFDFTIIKEEELKARIRGVRAESGPNVYMPGIDEPEKDKTGIKIEDSDGNYSWIDLTKLVPVETRIGASNLVNMATKRYETIKGNLQSFTAKHNEQGTDLFLYPDNGKYYIAAGSFIFELDKNPTALDYRHKTGADAEITDSEKLKKQPVSSLIKTDYKNDFELNKAIEALLDRKWNDPVEKWNATELEFITGYSGYGGLDEYGEISKGSLFEFFTPDKVIEKMWGLAYKYGYKEGRLIEPSAGIGLFLKREYVKSLVIKDAYEINKYSARICKLLYPEVNVNDGQDLKYFEQLFIKNNYTVRDKVKPVHELVIGNPPYGEAQGLYMGMGEKSYTKAKNYIDYFIFRGLDLLIPGGLLVYIIGAEVAGGGVPWLDQGTSKCKELIQKKGKLIDAYRLPEGVFARTNVVSDIVIFRKR